MYSVCVVVCVRERREQAREVGGGRQEGRGGGKGGEGSEVG